MENNSEEKPQYYTVLPANVRYDTNLSANAKILYSEIVVLAKNKGYCHASNSYFGKIFNTSKASIKRWLSELENMGYLKRENIFNSNGTVCERRVYIEDLPSYIFEPDGFNNEPTPRFNNELKGGVKSEPYNNTSNINNTSINNIPNNEKLDPIPYKKILDYLNQKANKSFRAVEGNKKYIRARWNEGYQINDFETVVDNMVYKWKGVTFKDGNNAEQYLRPSTLFGNKFDVYLNETVRSSATELGYVDNAPSNQEQVIYGDEEMKFFNDKVESGEIIPDTNNLMLLNEWRLKQAMPEWRIN